MKKTNLFSLLLLFLCLEYTAVCAENQTTIFVRNNGKPVRASEVVIMDKDNVDGKPAKRLDSASYLIETIRNTGAYVLVNAPNSRRMDVLLYRQQLNDTIIVDLSDNTLRNEFFWLYGNYNDFDKETMLPFDAENGVFHVAVKSTKKNLVYSFRGDTETGANLCDMNADSIIYQNGEFFSVRNSENGEFNFDVPLIEFKRANREASMRSTNNEELNAFLGILKGISDRKVSFFSKRPISDTDIDEYLLSVERLIASAANPIHKKLYAYHYLDVATIVANYTNPKYKLNKELLMECINTIPANDAIWLKNPYKLINSLLISEHSGTDSILKEFVEAFKSSETSYNAIDLVASFYKSKNDKQKLSRLLEIVQKNQVLIPNSGLIMQDAKSFLDSRSKSDSSFAFISLSDTSQIHEISDFQGKFVLVDFWATWCTGCINEINSTLIDVSKELPADKFVMLSISTDNNVAKTCKFYKSKIKASWAFGIMPNGHSYMKSKFNNNYLPFKVLYNPEGRIVAWGDDLSGDDLVAAIKKYMER